MRNGERSTDCHSLIRQCLTLYAARHLINCMGQTSKKQELTMNKQLAATERGLISSAAPHVMTRREKLLRFAMIVRTSRRNFVIFHHLEYMTEPQLRDAYHPESAFAAAAADPILSDAGLASDRVVEAQRFFELSNNDLHEFSCDCGGGIRNHTMADPLEALADRP